MKVNIKNYIIRELDNLDDFEYIIKSLSKALKDLNVHGGKATFSVYPEGFRGTSVDLSICHCISIINALITEYNNQLKSLADKIDDSFDGEEKEMFIL